MLQIVAYVLSLPIVAVLSGLTMIPAMLVLYPILYATRGTRIAMVHNFLLNLAAVVSAVMLYVILCRAIGARPTCLMFLPPLIGFMINDLGRIRAAETGTSRVARWVRASGETYDPQFNVGLEYAAMWGTLTGMIVAVWVFGLPFI